MENNFRLSILKDASFLEFNSFVGSYKFGDPVGLVFAAAESFIQSEILHRKAERAKMLGVSSAVGLHHEELSRLHNTQGLRRLRRASDAVKKAKKMFPNVIKEEDELVSTAEMRSILKDYDLMIKNELLEMDIPAVEAKEIWAEYAKARKIADTKGMSGLVAHFSSKIDELIKARTDLKAGRKHASPLPWWKIVLIAVALVVSIGSVIYCYKKQDCKWVWNMVKAIGGALWETLKSGC